MHVSTVRKLSLTALALVVALAWGVPGAAQETGPAIAELPTGGSTCSADLSPLSDQDAPIPAQNCGPCLLDFCADVYIRCSFSQCGLNNECCEYFCQCDASCTSGGIPSRVCLPLDLPDQCCGNGIQEDPEQCDGSDLGGETCASRGLVAGTLACFSNCTFNTSGCTCGNGVQEDPEECDDTDLDGMTCESLGFYGGTLACNYPYCTFDTSGCATCGNGIQEDPEECDGTDLDGMTCASFGYTGTLACSPDCKFDPSDCCGDGTCAGGDEDCETCPADCEGKATGPPSGRFCCGNGVMEPAEGNGTICDGNY